MGVDLLLLNCTNLPWRPIFPYAFVQVSAIARREGKSVRVADLLDVPRERLAEHLAALLEEARPRMIGLHIRQCDSVFLDDYFAPLSGRTRGYFPVEDNRALVGHLRRLTDAPIMAGGFGFTTHARRLFEYLDLDFGVQGCPDDIFLRYDDLLADRGRGAIRGLVHRAGGATAVNERGYYAPLGEREYDAAMVDELVRFYGHAQLFGPNPPTIAVEVSRGCPFSCFFCTEPHVKGRALRYRDLDVIEAELDYLVRRRLRRFWLICSELDIQGPGFGLTLAERIVRLRERHGGAPIEWSAYALPRLGEAELRLLQRSGYAGALNDVLSLDDDNLRRAGVPYRSKQAVAFLKAVTRLEREEAASAENAATAEGKVRAGLVQRSPKELATVLGMFLGNAHATPTTLATTLRRIEEEGLRETYRAALAFPATRVFAPDGVPICAAPPRATLSFGPEGERAADPLWPTFYFPDFLVERLGSPAAVVELMRYVADTFMSVGHRARKDWAWFLTHHVSIEQFVEWLALAGPLRGGPALLEGALTLPGARALFAPPPAEKQAWNAATPAAIAHALSAHPEAARRVRDALGLEAGLSEYRLIERLYARHDSADAVLRAVAPEGPAERFFLDHLLYENNVVLRPEYRELLFGPGPAQAAG
ncbi:MAG TPA: radical SAM protein [Kofleriaceae bacterium]|nr:radical SAM protein [Kofleriaceae bacterium]